MANTPKSHLQYRDNNNGRFLTDKKAVQLPPNRTTHERVPTPGNGDTGRYDKRK